ncbi:putative disease resistance RPP13-like protein 3 [Salvia splendens]|uniref:putative disease resistance RPP13-like protein 3 n=1 Tax=Salvia splendens TaxID=180675 RepID=UPI001C25AD65|nr:putative disease resistance RPP13-like protein 3 [Salvia splendens]
MHILEKSSLTNIPSNLESRIRDVSYKAKDIIESRMVSSKLMQDRRSKFEQVVSNRVSLAFPTPDLQQVTQELDSAMEQVVKLMEGKKTMLSGASFSHGEVQQLESVNLVEGEEKKMPDLSTSKNDLVGVDADLLQLKDRLTNMQSKLEIIPITGMSGIANVKASIVESEEQCSNILSLSYNHLPIYLELCFLYMGAFPEDYKINGSRLISLWIAEGFVKSNGGKSLEEEAMDYLKLLLERNLLLVRREKSNGKALSYSIHDLLRDLCIRKANEEKFIHVKDSMRRVSVESSDEMNDVCASPQLMSLARSFICTNDRIISPIFCILKLVRVLDVMGMLLEEFPEEILQLVNLRYLAINCSLGLPKGISRLNNLQTLICPHRIPYVTSELGGMSELRHIRLVMAVIEIQEIQFDIKKMHTLFHA